MTQKTMQLDIVSAQASIYSGQVISLVAMGKSGELGIYPGHMALLTALKPGQVVATQEDGQEQVFYISGGMLEVQPGELTVLADTALRAHDIDEAAAQAVKTAAEQTLSNQKSGVEYSRALTELAESAAQLRAISTLRKRAGRN